MPPPIVIDTCAMQDGNFCEWLYNYRGRKILPMVAYVEFSVYLRNRGRSQEKVQGLLKRLGVEIEPFSQVSAHMAVETAVITKDFRKNWRDHMIAGHAHTAPLKLITYNVDDFGFLGTRVLTPQQAMTEL